MYFLRFSGLLAFLLVGCGQGLFSNDPIQVDKPRQSLNLSQHPAATQPVFEQPQENPFDYQTPQTTNISDTQNPTTETPRIIPATPPPVAPNTSTIADTTAPSEPIVHINKACTPLNVRAKSVTSISLRVFSLEHNWQTTLTHPSLTNSIMSQRRLPTGMFKGVPDGNYTVMFCNGNSSRCSYPSTNHRNIALQFDMYTKNLSPSRNEPLFLVNAFGVMEDSTDPRLGGIPKLQIRSGAPVVPSKAGPASSGLFKTVTQLGTIISGSGGLFAKGCVHSPLMVEFSDKAIQLSSQKEGVQFDMSGDGQKENISWVTQDTTAFVVLDKNGNGQIDSVHELFGNNTLGPDGKLSANGFEALAKYNDHQDDVIDARDSVFKDLKLWFDYNSDAIVDAGELVSLADRGVAKFHLRYVDMYDEDRYGNITAQRSVITMQDKTEYRIFDIWFMAD